jgi:glutathione peroxidase
MQKLMGGVCAGLLVLLASASWCRADDKGDKTVPGALNFKMDSLDGHPVDLSKYQGKVILMVNVASKCGFTPQYKALEALHEKYGNEGFVVLGFPANNFGRQEPGTNEQISEFCQSKFGVKFDMFSKVSVNGSDQCPLYKFLTSKETDPHFSGPIRWNFEKFLINSKGEVVNRFKSQVKPDSPEVTKAIEAELAKK